MSAESEEVFLTAVQDYGTGSVTPEVLQTAAVQHLNCSRSLAELTELYAAALEAGDHAAAQELADELAPVRAAGRAASGIVPRSS